MILFPHCKINLGLHVLNRRKDGFHNIQSVLYPVPLCDILELTEAKTTSVVYSGIHPGCPPTDDLCIKAIKSLKRHIDLPEFQIHLHKNIPAGAGLGGGSSDAAFVIAGILKHLNTSLPDEILLKILENIGSDCGFFLKGIAALAENKGEYLTPLQLNLSGLSILIAKPAVSVSTKEAYSLVKPQRRAIDLKRLSTSHPSQWKEFIVNDFEKAICSRYPEIEKIKQKMYGLGALYASMSGSGSAVFGLFSSKVNPENTFEGNFLWQGILS